MRIDRDGAWKEAIERFLREFLDFFFPRVSRDIDWSRKPIFRNLELRKIVPQAESRKGAADSLVQVWLRDGRQTWLLIHIEVQEELRGRRRRAFPERMFRYNYRIFDRYRREVASLAVLTGKGASCMGEYRMGRWGSEHRFRFPVATIEPCRRDREALERNPNPFAIVVLAHLESQEKRSVEDRFRWKFRLMRLLLERKHRRRTIMELLRFIDWLVVLPRELEKRLQRKIAEHDREKAMPHVLSWVRIASEEGIEKGRKVGREEGLRDAIELSLRVKFGREGLKLLPRLRRIRDIDKLREFQKAVLVSDGLDQLTARLKRRRGPARRS